MKSIYCDGLLRPTRIHNGPTANDTGAAAHKWALFTLALAMLVVIPFCRVQAQDTSLASTIEVVRADTFADRVSIITQSMSFSDKDAAVFWPLYRKYEYERSRVDDRRVAVIKEYSAKYPNLTDADAKSMAEEMIACDYQLAELNKKYLKKFNSVLPALTVAKFFQVEHRVDLLMDMRVESSLPPLARPDVPTDQTQPAPQDN